MRITVIGTGYLGAVHAAGMAQLGHDVLGVDVDAFKIEQLASGHAPFYEPGLPELLRHNISAGRLKFSTSLKEAADFGDVHFICVGTPQLPGSTAADMKYVDAVVQGLVPNLQPAMPDRGQIHRPGRYGGAAYNYGGGALAGCPRRGGVESGIPSGRLRRE